MKTYLIGFENDAAAIARYAVIRDEVENLGGDVRTSLSFGHGAAFVVLTLPDNVNVSQIASDAIGAETIASAVAQVTETVQPAQEVEHGTSEDSHENPESTEADFGGEFEM